MRTPVAEKLLILVRQGLHVVGPAPEHNPGLADHERSDRRLADIREALWADLDGTSRKVRRLGKGSISWGLTPDEILAAEHLAPDFAAGPPSGEIVFCHRGTPEGQIYFVANVDNDTAAEFTARFRATAQQIELWDPLTGTITAVTGAVAAEGRTALPLKLAARQSVFVVFPNNPTAGAAVRAMQVERAPRIVHIDGPWRITFAGEPNLGEMPVTGPLASLSLHPENAVRHFAGLLTYRTRLTLSSSDWKPGERAWLDLGRVAVIAEVRVNGRVCGTAWVAPYRVEVGDATRAGENELEIRVATTWANRLIGDASLPGGPAYNAEGDLTEIPAWLLKQDRAQSPEARRSFSTFRYYQGNEPLIETGLLGPVRLLVTADY
jgi:hypothetical protein